MRPLPGILVVLIGLTSTLAFSVAEAHGGRDRAHRQGGSTIIVPPPGSTVIIVPRPRSVPPTVGSWDPVQPSWRHRPPPVFVPPVMGWPHQGPGFSSQFHSPHFQSPHIQSPHIQSPWSSRQRW